MEAIYRRLAGEPFCMSPRDIDLLTWQQVLICVSEERPPMSLDEAIAAAKRQSNPYRD